jgi:hypothetical protein
MQRRFAKKFAAVKSMSYKKRFRACVTKIVSDQDDLRLTAQAIQLATNGWVGGVGGLVDHYSQAVSTQPGLPSP